MNTHELAGVITVRQFTEHRANAAANRELVREAIARHLAQVFGHDNATRYEDEPNRIGVSFADGIVIDVRIDRPPALRGLCDQEHHRGVKCPNEEVGCSW